jgi:uncharacterized protein (DUF58 family)
VIPEAVMRELRYIEIYTAKKIRTLRVGIYTSPLRGAGFDFDEHRLYREGDDIRRIDWNVTARMNVPYLRQTHAERELNVVLVVDTSRSMRFGTRARTKKEAMTLITGSLLFSAISDQINTGFLGFSDRVLAFSPPRRSKARAWTLLEELWALNPPPGPSSMLPAIQHLLDNLKRMSIVFLVSDFMMDDGVLASPELRMLASRHDVVGVVVQDPAEMDLPSGSGFVRLRDVETGRRVVVGLGRHARARYAEEVAARRERLVRSFYNVPMDHVFIRTDESPIEPLLRLFLYRTRV